MNETNLSRFRKRATVLAVASCMALAPMIGDAAGLGKLTVLSGLGQPLRAEVDISASKDELPGMTAKLAAQDSFKQAGVEFSSVLHDLRFSVEKRAGGQSVVRVTSVKPINEPFLDFLVELNWPSGRLVREYTFLLDPPEVASKQARPVVDARVVETVRAGGATEDKPMATKPAAPERFVPSTPKVAAETTKKSDLSGTRVVQQGETLRKIAGETKYENVTLEQMLVGLFKRNPDAFAGQNINRLKAGAILSIPDQAAVQAVPAAEAKKVYVSQSADWGAYRQKLAASTEKLPAKEDGAATQASAGKITAKVEDKAAPSQQNRDQVKVARTDAEGKNAAATRTADQIAADKALKDAQERVSLLEKNVNELQKLLELKNQKLAELQQPVKKEEPKPVEAPKAVEVAKPADEVKPAPKPEESPKPVEPPKAEEAPKPVEAPKAPESKPVDPPQPKPIAPPPPAPTPEPSVVDTLLEDPLPLIGGGGVLALLVGYLVMRRRRGEGAQVQTTAIPMPSSLGPNSVFRMTGGQSVDTGNTPPQTGEFSQAGPGTIDTDEVDPVAEADVYMAYGRDSQAEEILLDALQKDPQRTAIHAKLLEIYANRRSTKQFETLASELYAQTGGAGPEWAKVAALGLGLDPNNPLYLSSRQLDIPAPAGDIAEAGGQLTIEMPASDLSPVVSDPTPLPSLDSEESPAAPDYPAAAESVDTAEESDNLEVASNEAMALDFDLGGAAVSADEVPAGIAETVVQPAAIIEEAEALDFDLGTDATLSANVGASSAMDQPQSLAGSLGADFDLGVAELSAQGAVPQGGQPAPDFSPEGTMVMPMREHQDDVDFGLGTWVGVGPTDEAVPEQPESFELPTGPVELADATDSLKQTVVNQLAAVDTIVDENLLKFSEAESELAQTIVNPGIADTGSLDFDVNLGESVFLGEAMQTPEFDIGSINLDLSSPPSVEAVPSSDVAPMPDAVAEPISDAPRNDALWEEANTKLDLAKAYEEMGDLEGARELLQEVIGDAPVDLSEQAKTILDRIGG